MNISRLFQKDFLKRTASRMINFPSIKGFTQLIDSMTLKVNRKYSLLFVALGVTLVYENNKITPESSGIFINSAIKSAKLSSLVPPLYRSINPLPYIIGALMLQQYIVRRNKMKNNIFPAGFQLIGDNQKTLTLDDFSGQDNVKSEIKEIIDFFKNPEKFEKLGAMMPKGILITGPPGTGKTLLAKIFAAETGLNFYSISGSEILGQLVGQSAENIRKLFNQARSNSPSIIFIDEIDSIGRKRTGDSRNIEYEATLNQLLVDMDMRDMNARVIVMAATNLKESLDSALLRTGRFDRIIELTLPGLEGRKSILKQYLSKLRLEKEKLEEFAEVLAKNTSGLTGSDLSCLCNEAAIRAGQCDKDLIDLKDLEFAADRVLSSKTSEIVGFQNTKQFNNPDATLFKDIAGQDEAIVEIQEVVDFLKNPEKYEKIGAKMPKGLLLIGPPGTGKTMFAKACAGESDVPFFAKAGSEFVDTYVGVGASRVRELFAEARRLSPSIIFIDEIDSIGGKRGDKHIEYEATLNQLLVEMDGFKKFRGIVMGASNRLDMIDPALLRPGRFDRIVHLKLPDLQGRVEILTLSLKRYILHPGYSIEQYASIIAKQTSGLSGAELTHLCNEAAIFAVRANKTMVELDDFNLAIIKAINRLNHT